MYKPIRAIAAAVFMLPLVASADEAPRPGDGPGAPGPATVPSVTANAPGAAEGAKPGEPARPPPWYSAVTVNGLVSGYYQARLDAAQDAPLTGRAFDAPLGFTLDQALLSASMAPGPVGFRLDLLFGNTNSVIDAISASAAGTTGPTVANHVLQAYAALKLGPAELNVGRFVTSASAEVVPVKDNWLYSRSLLFNLVPVTHTGARVTVPVTDTITVQGSVVDGWDAVTSPLPGKTGELQIAYSGPNATTLAITSYIGDNPTVWSGAPNTTGKLRTLVDAVAGTTVGPLGLSLNADWANEAADAWYGFSAMARYALPGDFLRVTGRGEYVRDCSGARFGTGKDTEVWEVTTGLSVPVASNAEIRAELRFDKATRALFTPASAPKDSQATATLAALAWF